MPRYLRKGWTSAGVSNLGLRRKVVTARIAAHDEEGVNAANAGVRGVVQVSVGEAAFAKSLEPAGGRFAKLLDFAELYRFGGASCRAGRLEPFRLAVIAERTFEGTTIVGVALDDAERTGRNAIGATIADV